jgi:hypothetical protein
MSQMFEARGPSWQRALCRYIVDDYQPLSTVESPSFKGMVYALSPKAQVPSRKTIYQLLFSIKCELEQHIRTMTAGQAEAITVDGWTSCANVSYHSLTRQFVNEHWELVSLALECVQHDGRTTAVDLANSVKEMLAACGATDIVGIVTDCEPSMVAAGRLLTADGILHTGCVDHRLEKVTEVFFTAAGKCQTCSCVLFTAGSEQY